MSDQISFTIPVTPSALNRTITMLKGMADDLNSTPSLFDRAVELAKASIPTPTPTPVVIIPTPTVPGTAAVASLNEVVEDDEDDAPESDGSGVDTRGILWDARIHSANKSKMQNGAWKRKRNISDELVASVELEQTGEVVTPEPVVATVVAPAAVVATVAPIPTPEPVVVVPEPVLAPVAITTFPAFMAAVTAKGIPAEQVLEACKSVDLPSLQVLPTRPHLIPTVAMILGL